jgi:predicted oxidoreductase
LLREQRTNVAGKHEEVIVRQAAVLLGINERLDVNAIALGVLVLEHLEGLGEVQGVGGGVNHGVAVLDGHDKKGSGFSRN